jgi:hypothetical protein
MSLMPVFRLPWIHHLGNDWMQFARSEAIRSEATRFDWLDTGSLRCAKPT